MISFKSFISVVNVMVFKTKPYWATSMKAGAVKQFTDYERGYQQGRRDEHWEWRNGLSTYVGGLMAQSVWGAKATIEWLAKQGYFRGLPHE